MIPVIRAFKAGPGWLSELLWEGLTFNVPGPDAGLGVYSSEQDARRAAEAYRKTFTPPSARELADMDRRANSPSKPSVSVRMGSWE